MRRAELGLVGTAALLVFSRVFGLSIVLPNFRSYYEGSLGFDPFWVGMALGAHGLSMALMQLPLGMLSDKIGRRPVLIAASILFVAGSLLAARADSEAMLLGARILQGTGAVGSVAMAAVGETVRAESRTTAMAMVGIPAGLGFMAGLAAGPLLFPTLGMEGLFMVVALVGGLAAAPVFFVHFAHAEARPVAVERMAPRVLALALAGFMLNLFLTLSLFFLQDTSAKTLLPMLLVAFVAMGLLARRIDKAGWTWQPPAIGLLVLALASPAFGLSPSPWWLVAGAVFFSAHAILSAAIPSQVSRAAGASGGRGHGIQNVIAQLGTFAGGTLAGAFAGRPDVAFAIAALGAVAAATLLWRSHAPQP